ncbi:MAG: hypothetical protein ACO3A2_05315 [Bdellovibrionia bacterium]
MFSFQQGWSVTLTLSLSFLGILFHACVENRPVERLQSPPTQFSMQTEAFWRAQVEVLHREFQNEHQQITALFLELKKKKLINEEISQPKKAETALEGTYGELPEIFVDQGHGAIFPLPINRPQRFSSFQNLRTLKQLLKNARELKKKLLQTQHPEALLEQWNPLSLQSIQLSQSVRYLDQWIPLLKPKRASLKSFILSLFQKDSESPTDLTRYFFQSKEDSNPSQKNLLKPRRVLHRSFLPENLNDTPAGIISIPIATDIQNKRFLKEFEGAVDTHWNGSSWAKHHQVSFHIQWTFVKKNASFAQKKEDLKVHLKKFPAHHLILTSGAPITHVSNDALILGPGKTTPRTLAHEFGHLLGFNDCYLRTLTSQGLFGLAILEWDNPIYPDDLMCDNTLGEPRVEVW